MYFVFTHYREKQLEQAESILKRLVGKGSIAWGDAYPLHEDAYNELCRPDAVCCHFYCADPKFCHAVHNAVGNLSLSTIQLWNEATGNSLLMSPQTIKANYANVCDLCSLCPMTTQEKTTRAPPSVLTKRDPSLSRTSVPARPVDHMPARVAHGPCMRLLHGCL